MPTEFDIDGVVERDSGTEFDRDGVLETGKPTYIAYPTWINGESVLFYGYGTLGTIDPFWVNGESSLLDKIPKKPSSTWINGESKLIHDPSTSVDFAWIGGESFVLDNQFDYSEDVIIGYCYGEENPTEGETPTSWTTFSDGAAGSPTVLGDSDWGKLSLGTNLIAHGPVVDSGNTNEKTLVVKRDFYGTGQGNATLHIRGQAGVFTQDAGSPSWELYSSPINKTWRYFQVKVTATGS